MSWRSASGHAGMAGAQYAPVAAGGEGVQNRQADEEYRQRLQALEADFEHKLTTARENGLREGEVTGRKAASAEVEAALGRLMETATDLTGMRAKLREEAQEDLVKLSLGIARRVLHRELQTDVEAIAGVVKAALERLQASELSRVRTHPDHENVVRDHLQRLGVGDRVTITCDPSLSPGSLILETGRASLDASIDAQLLEIERGFADRLGR